jgi:CBS domain-containing protein
MNENLRKDVSSRMILDSATAADLMTTSPISLRADATVQEAVALLTDRGISGAPVIDEAGRPVGVLSRADIVVHDRESGCQGGVPNDDGREHRVDNPEEVCPPGFHVEVPDLTLVRDMMTPTVFSVPPDAPARRVVEDMVGLKIHRLFVVGTDGVLTGVISALDVLQRLRPEHLPVPEPAPAAACGRPPYGYEPW